MINYPIIIIVSLFLFSCGQNNEQGKPINISDSTVTAVDTVAILNDPKNNLSIQTNSITAIDSSGIILFPLSMGDRSRKGGSYYYKDFSYSTYWNIIFFNSKTSEYHLLSERKMLISGFDLQYNSDGNTNFNYSNEYIYYKVTVEDYNQDKKLTTDDPEYLFVSDKEGKNFRQISPGGYNLESWQYIKASNKVIMTVKKDTDNNKKFGEEEEVASFQIDLNKETLPTEIFSADFKKKLKVLYDKDWKRIN